MPLTLRPFLLLLALLPLASCGAATEANLQAELEAMHDRLAILDTIEDAASAAEAVEPIRRTLRRQAEAAAQLTDRALEALPAGELDAWLDELMAAQYDLGEWFGFTLRVSPEVLRAMEDVLSPGALRALELFEETVEAERDGLLPRLEDLLMKQPDHDGPSPFFRA